jgi:hypothetical protein
MRLSVIAITLMMIMTDIIIIIIIRIIIINFPSVDPSSSDLVNSAK